MERVLSIALWIADLFDLRSSDPAVAAIKRARLLTVLFMAATVTCIAVAFCLQPNLSSSEKPEVLSLVSEVQQIVATGFMIAAVVCNLGMIWNTWVWYRAHTKPETYY